MINRHYRTQIRGIRETVDGVFDGEGNQQIIKTNKKGWKTDLVYD